MLPVSAKTPFKARAAGYGIPGYYIDGNDVLAVYEFIQKAAETLARVRTIPC